MPLGDDSILIIGKGEVWQAHPLDSFPTLWDDTRVPGNKQCSRRFVAVALGVCYLQTNLSRCQSIGISRKNDLCSIGSMHYCYVDY